MDDNESFDRLATDPDFQRYLGMVVRAMQIFVFVMTLGVVFFGVLVVVVLGVPAAAFRANGPLFGWIAIAVAAGLFAVRPVVLAATTAAARKGKATNFDRTASAAFMQPFIRELQQRLPTVVGWLHAYLTQVLLGCALLEGAAFFNVIAYSQEPWIGNLAVAGVLVLMLLLQFPTRDRVVDWVGQQIRQSRIEA